MSEDRNSRRRPGLEQPSSIAFPRRRLGRVEHDERGNARMEWALLNDDSTAGERVVLELAKERGAGGTARAGGERADRGGFQPYGSPSVFTPEPEPPRKPKDLRKLGEWLKMTRELEARRKRGETGD